MTADRGADGGQIVEKGLLFADDHVVDIPQRYPHKFRLKGFKGLIELLSLIEKIQWQALMRLPPQRRPQIGQPQGKDPLGNRTLVRANE